MLQTQLHYHMQGHMYCYTVTIDGIVVLYNLCSESSLLWNYIVEVTVRLLSHDLLAAVSGGYCHGTCNGYDQEMHPMTL